MNQFKFGEPIHVQESKTLILKIIKKEKLRVKLLGKSKQMIQISQTAS